MAEEGEWFDISMVGDSWEVQINAATSKYRHRPMQVREPIITSSNPQYGFIETEWRNGKPPDGLNAEPA